MTKQQRDYHRYMVTEYRTALKDTDAYFCEMLYAQDEAYNIVHSRWLAAWERAREAEAYLVSCGRIVLAEEVI